MKKIIGLQLQILIALATIALNYSCNKEDVLNAKPATALAIPSTIGDFQAMLDNDNNYYTFGLGEASSDNYYMKDGYYASQFALLRNTYLWKSDIFESSLTATEWDLPYSTVLTCNLVLEGINTSSINTSSQTSWNALKGSAYFLRGYTFFNLSQTFCGVYDAPNANNELGIPLKLSSDINTTTTRTTIQQTYDQIVSDINAAKGLLPNNVDPNNKFRPTKVACYALLSRVYLSMRNYDLAGKYADSCLQLYSTLINYNSVPMSVTVYRPWNLINNDEVIFNSNVYSLGGIAGSMLLDLAISPGGIGVDSSLYNSYSTDDLRRSIFFRFSSGTANLNGSYGGLYNTFSGLATDEVLLIRAESKARAGSTSEAMNDLNALLIKRYRNNTFVPLSAANPTDALNKILIERRKELPFRNVRWSDLRRLNKEGAGISLTRVINGQTYTLAPNDPRYVFPIPNIVIQLSGISQNPR